MYVAVSQNSLPTGPSWYLSFFADAKDTDLVMEKTPMYIVQKDAATRMYEFNPNMFIIFIFRDPFVRTVSDYLEVTLRKDAPLDLPPINEYLRPVEGGPLDTSVKIVQDSLYEVHMRKWFETFPRQQMLVSSL